MTVITVADVEYLASRLAKEQTSFDGSGVDFSLRDPDLLGSCVVTPFQRHSGKALYPSLVSKAGILFYFLIKNRPFMSGNKKLAVTALLTFLLLNKKWIKVDTPELFSFAVWIAQSPTEFKDQVVEAVQKFIHMHLVKSG